MCWASQYWGGGPSLSLPLGPPQRPALCHEGLAHTRVILKRPCRRSCDVSVRVQGCVASSKAFAHLFLHTSVPYRAS